MFPTSFSSAAKKIKVIYIEFGGYFVLRAHGMYGLARVCFIYMRCDKLDLRARQLQPETLSVHSAADWLKAAVKV